MTAGVKRRLKVACLSVFILLSISFLSLFLFKDEMSYYVTPSDVDENMVGKKLRVGGLVTRDSMYMEHDYLFFLLTDGDASIAVYYKGSLPPLFGEGRGIVAEGVSDGKVFNAEKLIAKHSEYYGSINN